MEHFSPAQLKKMTKEHIASFAKAHGFVTVNFPSKGNQYLSYQRKQTYGWDTFNLRFTNNHVDGFSLYYRFEEVESLFRLDGISCTQKDIYCTEDTVTFVYMGESHLGNLQAPMINSLVDAKEYLNVYMDILALQMQDTKFDSVIALFKHIELGPYAFSPDRWGNEWLWVNNGINPISWDASLIKVLIISKLCGDPGFEQKIEMIIEKYESEIPQYPTLKAQLDMLQSSFPTIRAIEQKYQVI
jgi:hypothetical protein